MSRKNIMSTGLSQEILEISISPEKQFANASGKKAKKMVWRNGRRVPLKIISHNRIQRLRFDQFSKGMPKTACSSPNVWASDTHKRTVSPSAEKLQHDGPKALKRKKSYTREEILLLRRVRDGFEHQGKPRLTEDGTGGVYILTGVKQDPVAVWKPSNEEAFAPANPRGYTADESPGMYLQHPDSPMRGGFVVGNGFLHERAIFLLDQNSAIPAGVPTAVIAKAKVGGVNKMPTEVSRCDRVPRRCVVDQPVGSLHQYKEHDGTADDYGVKILNKEQLQRIALLDLRTLNADRHSANILVAMKKHDGKMEEGDGNLIPIDHAFCLPDYLQLEQTTLDWMHWPQAKEKLCDEFVDLVNQIDIEDDVELMRETGIAESSIVTLQIGTSMIKTGCSLGLSLSKMTQFCVRKDPEVPSALEELISSVEKDMQANPNVKSLKGQLRYVVHHVASKLPETMKAFL